MRAWQRYTSSCLVSCAFENQAYKHASPRAGSQAIVILSDAKDVSHSAIANSDSLRFALIGHSDAFTMGDPDFI
jgi:hypothetical protein